MSLFDAIGTVQAMFQLAQKHVKHRHYEQAYRQLKLLAELDHSGKVVLSGKQKTLLKSELWQVSPIWWIAVRHGALTLRRCKPEDSDFFIQCYRDNDFARNFNRQAAWGGNLATALGRFGSEPPGLLGMLQWVVCWHEKPVGLASLSSINYANSRAEFSIGLPGLTPAGVAHKACLMAMHYVFFMVGLHKLYTYVYADNQRAIDATTRLGFHAEGFLQDHFHFLPDEFVSVFAFGLTKLQAQENPRLLRQVQRRINQNWLL